MSDTDQQINQTIADWLGDIVALESHVEEAMDHQLELEAPSPTLTQAIQHFHDSVRASKQRAIAYQEQYGSTAGNPVIKAGSELLGKAAGIIDKMRNDSVSKALRDDYTVYNHVAIAYTMLHATALALEDTATAQFAEEGLRTYASLVQKINQIIGEAAVLDLTSNDNAPVINPNVGDRSRETVDRIWSTTQAS